MRSIDGDEEEEEEEKEEKEEEEEEEEEDEGGKEWKGGGAYSSCERYLMGGEKVGRKEEEIRRGMYEGTGSISRQVRNTNEEENFPLSHSQTQLEDKEQGECDGEEEEKGQRHRKKEREDGKNQK